MRTGLPKSGVAPRRANITTPRCQSRAATPRPRERSRHHIISADIRTHRRGATALCHNPVRGAQRSVPEVRHYSRARVRPRERSRLQLTPDSVGGTRTDADAPQSAAADAPRAAERTKKSPSRGWRIQKYKCGLDYLTITLVAVPLARTT